MSTASQLDALRSGEVDVGFVREPSPSPGIVTETVAREPLVVVLGREHPLARRRDLAGEPFIFFPPELAPGLHALILSLCHRAGFAPRVVHESRDVAATVGLAEAGVGLTIVPDVMRRAAWRGVSYRPIRSRRAVSSVAMAWRHADTTAALGLFVQAARPRKGEGRRSRCRFPSMIPVRSRLHSRACQQWSHFRRRSHAHRCSLEVLLVSGDRILLRADP